jgi:2-deoxy-D-gluconate 3-dehydrogenase
MRSQVQIMSFPSFRVDGKMAIVTGAAQGIGRSIALGLANAGAELALVDIDAASLRELAIEIENMGRRALTFTLDLSDTAAIAPMVAEAARHFGAIDILVNNAGVRVHKRVFDHSVEDWERTLRINCTAPLVACQAAAGFMRSQGAGSIVNITSQMAEVTSPHRVAYCASKAALTQMTRVMAVDWAEYGIRVNAVAPGPTTTPFTSAATASGAMPVTIDKVPLRRIAEADEMVGAVLYFASSASSFATGSVLTVDGGQSVHWR